MRIAGGIALLAALALGGCSTAPRTGWRRASDLSIYAAMATFARNAREQQVLCQGFDPARVATRWDEDYSARHDAVTRALAARYGEAEVIGREAPRLQRVPCAAYPGDPKWRSSYVRLLRLLETRLGS